MKIYTRTGDDGSTSLYGGKRVSKNDARVEAYGSVDELNAWLGLVRSQQSGDFINGVLDRVQGELFTLGGELARGTPPASPSSTSLIAQSHIDRLEQDIDEAQRVLPALNSFILPGGTQAAASLQLARTVARRAERAVVTLHAREPVRDELLRYLNRLSDLLFVLARRANHDAGRQDIPWSPA